MKQGTQILRIVSFCNNTCVYPCQIIIHLKGKGRGIEQLLFIAKVCDCPGPLQFQREFSTFPRSCFISHLIAGFACLKSSVSEIILKSNSANGFLFLHMFKQSRRKIRRCQVLAYFQIIFYNNRQKLKDQCFCSFSSQMLPPYFCCIESANWVSCRKSI